jgi:DHA2 family multidrug resistance protein
MALWGVGVMLGPILGPTLGGWLTEYYNWRWVFFINVPVGIFAAFGLAAFMPETPVDKRRRFDIFGFALLSLALGSLQLMLDRGPTKDWFSSPEIVAEALVAALALYLFVVHILTAEKPFLDPAMFRDRNYSFGLIFMFVMGILILATMALLPPYLQGLMGYPVVTTGLVLAPRGIGTMAAMLVVGRILGKVDVRLVILAGLSLTALSLWQMSEFNLEITQAMLVHTGMLQGFGMGCVFVPLSTIAYATLPGHFRNDATAVFSLVRNIGSSLGVSIMVMLVARYTQINHAELGARITPFGSSAAALQALPQTPISPFSTAGLSLLNGEVTRQAAAISYLNDFRLLALIVLMSIPALLFLKARPHKVRAEETLSAVE